MMLFDGWLQQCCPHLLAGMHRGMLLVGAESSERPEPLVLSSEEDSGCMDDGALAMSECGNVELQRAHVIASIEMEPAELGGRNLSGRDPDG
jgi:hypothetical protein